MQHPIRDVASAVLHHVGDRAEIPSSRVLLREQRHRRAGPPRSAAASDPVNVRVRGRGEVVVDDGADADEIHPARHEVGGDERPRIARAEPVHLMPIAIPCDGCTFIGQLKGKNAIDHVFVETEARVKNVT